MCVFYKGKEIETPWSSQSFKTAISSKRLVTINYKIFLYGASLNNATLEARIGHVMYSQTNFANITPD